MDFYGCSAERMLMFIQAVSRAAPADSAGQYPSQVHLILGNFTEF